MTKVEAEANIASPIKSDVFRVARHFWKNESVFGIKRKIRIQYAAIKNRSRSGHKEKPFAIFRVCIINSMHTKEMNENAKKKDNTAPEK